MAAKGLQLISDVIGNSLNIDVSVLMGANIASEIALGNFSETTVGYRIEESGRIWKKVFDTPAFKVSIIGMMLDLQEISVKWTFNVYR